VGGIPLAGLPDDWSHHRMVFSDPGTAQEAIQKGTYDHWFSVVNDPRYIIQQLKRRAPAQGPAAEDVARIENEARDAGFQWNPQTSVPGELQGSRLQQKKKKNGTKKDWSVGLGAGTPMTAVYPATWSASPTTASCASDFAVYVTGSASSSTQASIVAYNNLYSGCTGTVPSVYWAYNTSATANTSPVMSPDGTQIAFVQYSSATGNPSSIVLLKWHSNTTGRGVTGSLSASSPNVTLTSGTFSQADVGAQISGTGIPAGDTIASVISNTTANLAVAPSGHSAESLTITAEALATPGVAPTVAVGSYRGCTAPCMTTLPLTNSKQDSFSNAYYDFTSDSLYVGDNGGYLHKFAGVFNGTPSTTEASGFPVQLGSGTYALTSPIVDGGAGVVMVGNKGGSAFWVTTSGTLSGSTGANSACAGTTGVDDNPLVDGSAETEYVFYNDIHISSFTYDDQIVEYNYVASPPSTAIATVNVGNSQRNGLNSCGNTAYFFSGNFDNVYFQSANGTGNLWVVGNSFGPSHLYSVAITNNVMAMTSTSQAILSSSTPFGYGSPVTEFCNNGSNACAANSTQTTSGTDYLFFSVYQGALSGCMNSSGHGCVMSFNITTPGSPSLAGALDETAPTTVPLHATGGIVIDNALSSPTGTSNIYFSTRRTTATCGSGPTGICAVQASQVP